MRFAIVFVLSLSLLTIFGCENEQVYDVLTDRPCEGSDDVFDCIAMKVIESGNPNYCEQVSVNQSYCYLLAGLKTQDYFVCDRISDSKYLRFCKIYISLDKGDMSTCEKYAWDDSADNIISGLPTKLSCESYIKNKMVKVIEKGKVKEMYDFRGSGTIEECEEEARIVEMGNPDASEDRKRRLKETCYYDAAVFTKNPELCVNLSKNNYKSLLEIFTISFHP